jgi:hypothetical protein
MNNPSSETHQEKPPQANWAAPVKRLDVSTVPDGAVNINVRGRGITNPLTGFGQMWQKTYRIRLSGAQATPQEVIRVWKENFASFWPRGNYFYGSGRPIQPGDVAVLNLAGPGGLNAPGGSPLISTGVLVIYADEESFSFLTPEGHMFAGLITFRVFEEESALVAQIQALVRGSDPLYEVMLRIGIGHKMEDDFWKETLRNLAAHFGVHTEPSLTRVCVDSRVQWSGVRNIWHNAGIRTTFYTLGMPFRWIGRKMTGR